jgi:hypothetical protein
MSFLERRNRSFLHASGFLFALGLCSGAHDAMARPDNGRDWVAHVGGGVTLAADPTRERLDDGWSVQAGGSWFPTAGPFGLGFNAAFLSHDLSAEQCARLDANDGTVEVWPLTLDFLYSPRLHRQVGLYVVAGGGAAIVHGEVNGPNGTAPVACDPWWWSDCDGVFTVENYPRTVTEPKFAVNGGVGLEFGTGGSVAVYLESRFHYVFLENEAGRFVPITLGFRW